MKNLLNKHLVNQLYDFHPKCQWFWSLCLLFLQNLGPFLQIDPEESKNLSQNLWWRSQEIFFEDKFGWEWKHFWKFHFRGSFDSVPWQYISDQRGLRWGILLWWGNIFVDLFSEDHRSNTKFLWINETWILWLWLWLFWTIPCHISFAYALNKSFPPFVFHHT